MRRDKTVLILVSVACVAFLGAAMQFYLKSYSARVSAQRSAEREAEAKLRAELDRLARLQREMNNAGLMINDALEKERRKAESAGRKIPVLIAQNKALSERLDKLAVSKEDMAKERAELGREFEELKAQNAGLHKEIEILRRNFDVALQVKSRLSQVQESMNGLLIKKGKESVLQIQLESLGRELASINLYLANIRDNKLSSVPAVKPVEQKPAEKPQSLDPAVELKYMGQMNDLKARINVLSNDNTVLKEKYLMAQDIAAQHKKLLDAASQKIFSLQTKLLETESALAASQSRYKDLERGSAALRERYVANELEKEGLKVRLNSLTAELNDMKAKFLALLGKLSDIFKSPEGEAVSGRVGNLTSIIGVELIPGAENKK